jgi:hypothetical protein
MFFTLPWMLAGLVGVPALAAIYWLRSRAQVRVVSSLFLWIDQRRPKQGGRVVERMQAPLAFFLELLAIVAMILAAAGFSFTRSQFARPIVLVLDDSYSMRAGKTSSVRDRAREALAKEFQHTAYVARVVLAGSQPRLLGESIRTDAQLQEALEDWRCMAPTAALEPAIALAAEVGGDTARILVISDREPAEDLVPGKAQWWAFGQPLSNMAITAAARDRSSTGVEGEEDRTLLEITNLGSTSTRTNLALEGAGLAAPQRKSIELGPAAASRLIMNFASGSTELRATLDEDELTIDNAVVLVSPRRAPLRVQVAVADAEGAGARLHSSITRALEAAGQTLLVDSRPQLVIADNASSPDSGAWQFELLAGPDPVAFEGPYVVDRSHPLAEGLSLDAIIWSASEKSVPRGVPVITAGNRVLVADEEEASGQHRVQLAIDMQMSNLADSPEWPILIANLVRWRAAALPGPATTNLQLGQLLRFTRADDGPSEVPVVMRLPDGAEQRLPVEGKVGEVRPDQVGLYQISAGAQQFSFATNAVNADESNLSQCATGRWGSWNDSEVYQDQHVRLDWVFLLFAIGCLVAHLVVLSRAGAPGT